MAKLTKGLLPLVGTVSVASLLLGVVGLYHSRYAALKTEKFSPVEDLGLGGSGMKPWMDPDADAAAFITGSPAVQPAMAVRRGHWHAGSDSEAAEGTQAVEPDSWPEDKDRGSGNTEGERSDGVALYGRIKAAAAAHERVRRRASLAKHRRAILAKITAAGGASGDRSSATPGHYMSDAAPTRPSAARSSTVLNKGRGRTWLVDASNSASASAPTPTRHAPSVYLKDVQPTHWGHPVSTEGASSEDGVMDVTPEAEGMRVAGQSGAGASPAGPAVQRLRSAVQGPSGIAALGETADEAYTGGGDTSDGAGNPNAGKWLGGRYLAGKSTGDTEDSDAPWEFHGELGSASSPPRIDSTGPNPGQVPDLVSEHLHNSEFEGMLDECKRSSSCSALLSKGFWWLYGKPWRRCSQDDPYACIPYHCAANQEGTTECKILQNNPIQALVDMDVRCWDKGRSMWQFEMTRDGCKDYLPWRGGTGVREYLRIGYNCHGCDEECDGGDICCPPITEPNHADTCSMHWTECKPGSGPGFSSVGGKGVSKNWGGAGDKGENDWLAGHVVQCPPNSYLSEWRVDRERCIPGHLRIRYRCCEMFYGACRELSTTGSTSEWADGLEGHNVQCDERTESLNHFEWTGSNFKYTCCCKNKCCTPNFEGGRDSATRPYWPYGREYPIHPPEPSRPGDVGWHQGREPPDAPTYAAASGGGGGGYARPPPDDPKWLRGPLDALGNGKEGDDAGHGPVFEAHNVGIWKSDPMAQLASIAQHFDGREGQK